MTQPHCKQRWSHHGSDDRNDRYDDGDANDNTKNDGAYGDDGDGDDDEDGEWGEYHDEDDDENAEKWEMRIGCLNSSPIPLRRTLRGNIDSVDSNNESTD